MGISLDFEIFFLTMFSFSSYMYIAPVRINCCLMIAQALRRRIKKSSHNIFHSTTVVKTVLQPSVSKLWSRQRKVHDTIEKLGVASNAYKRQVIRRASLTHPILCRPPEPNCHPRRTSSPTRKKRHKSSVAEQHREQQNQTPTEPMPAGAPRPSSLSCP